MLPSVRIKLIASLRGVILIPRVAIYCIVVANVKQLSLGSYQEAADTEIHLVKSALSLFLENVQENVKALSLLPAASLEVVRNSAQASQTASEAKGKAQEGKAIVLKTIGAMRATKEVGESIRSIQEVAQDNISSMDRAVIDQDNVVALSNESGQVLEEIVRAVEFSSDQIQSIATAAEEQSAATEEITRSVDEINRIATDTSQGVGQTVTSLEEMTGQIFELKKLVQELEETKPA